MPTRRLIGSPLAASFVAIAALSTSATSALPPAPQLGLNLSACSLGEAKVQARCGTFVVYEDRAAASGRVIELPLAVVPAKRPTKQAIFWNPGGPGATTVAAAPFIVDGTFAKELAELRERYDIVFVDNRGIGGSGAQQCDLSPPGHPEYYFLQLWPDALLRACRDRLAAHANLSLYTSSLAADDLDDIRAALGYPKIVLDGNSYGSFLALVYMRQHPEHVESAVLDGVAPPSILVLPLQNAAGAQQAMSQLIGACEQDFHCKRSFPEFASHFTKLVDRFDGGPIEIRIRNPLTKKPQVVLLSKEVFADRLRQFLYDASKAAYVPYIVEHAYLRDYVPLGQMIDETTRGLASFVMLGANLSVTCAEDVPFITEDAIRSSSAGSFEGDTRVRAQQRACKIWDVKAVPASFNEPVRSEAPVLMVSGTDDPASPAIYAALELPYLPNATRVLVQGAAHVTETPCTDRLKAAFVLASSARDLDVASCSSAFRRPPFATSMIGFSGNP